MSASLGQMVSAWWAEARVRIADALHADDLRDSPQGGEERAENRLPVQVWLLVCAVGGLLALILALAGAPPIIRAPVVLSYLLIAPGRALVRLVRIPELGLRVSLVFALSFSVVGLISLVQAYGHAWNPTVLLVVVIMVTMAAALAELAQSRRRETA